MLTDRDSTLQEELAMRSAVAGDLGTDDVDLVFLRRATPVLRYEVVPGGRRLYARDDAEADRFEGRSVMEYFDTAWLRKVQQDLAREALR